MNALRQKMIEDLQLHIFSERMQDSYLRAVRQYGPTYRQNFSDQILPSHRQAMCAIEQCRTDGLGGKVYACPQCG